MDYLKEAIWELGWESEFKSVLKKLAPDADFETTKDEFLDWMRESMDLPEEVVDLLTYWHEEGEGQIEEEVNRFFLEA